MRTHNCARYRRRINEIFALLGCYAAYIGNYLPTFRDNLLFRSSGVKQFKIEQIGSPETSVNNYEFTVPNIAKDRRSRPVITLRHPAGKCSFPGDLEPGNSESLCKTMMNSINAIMEERLSREAEKSTACPGQDKCSPNRQTTFS